MMYNISPWCARSTKGSFLGQYDQLLSINYVTFSHVSRREARAFIMVRLPSSGSKSSTRSTISFSQAMLSTVFWNTNRSIAASGPDTWGPNVRGSESSLSKYHQSRRKVRASDGIQSLSIYWTSWHRASYPFKCSSLLVLPYLAAIHPALPYLT